MMVADIYTNMYNIHNVGKDLPRIVGKSSRPRSAILDIGRCDRDFLDQLRQLIQ